VPPCIVIHRHANIRDRILPKVHLVNIWQKNGGAGRRPSAMSGK
jgi:hypothetical protein